jgi:hypothetical protein
MGTQDESRTAARKRINPVFMNKPGIFFISMVSISG